eukprot:917215-Prymnesium_polylepis.2
MRARDHGAVLGFTSLPCEVCPVSRSVGALASAVWRARGAGSVVAKTDVRDVSRLAAPGPAGAAHERTTRSDCMCGAHSTAYINKNNSSEMKYQRVRCARSGSARHATATRRQRAS